MIMYETQSVQYGSIHSLYTDEMILLVFKSFFK